MPAEPRAAVLKQLADLCAQAKLSDKPVHDTAPENGPDDTNTTWGYAARFTPDGKRIVSSGFDLKVRVWDTTTGRHLKVLAEIPERPRSIAISPEGKRVAVSMDKVGVRVFDLETNAQIGEITYKPDPKEQWSGGFPVEFDRAGRLITPISQNEVGIFAADLSVAPIRLGPHLKGVRGLAVSNEAGLIVTGDGYGALRKFSLETGKLTASADVAGEAIDYLAASTDGKQLAVVIGGTVTIVGLSDDRPPLKIVAHPAYSVFALRFTKDGKGLITCRTHPELWNVSSGEKIRNFGPYTDLCHSIDVSPDGKYAVTTNMGSDVRLWEIDSGIFFQRYGRYIPGR